MSKAAIGAALLGGYALGRTKNGKLAMAVAAWVIKRNVDTKKITSAITGLPAMEAAGEQLREELRTAGKEASTAVVAACADKLADALHERTVSLREQTSELTERTGLTEGAKGAGLTKGEGKGSRDADEGSHGEGKGSRDREPGSDRKAAKPGRKKKAADEPAEPRGDRGGAGTKRRSEE